jgi:hypothetical protein
MSRVEENKELVEFMTNVAKENPSGTYEKMVCLQVGTIATMLADISKSLAMIADIKSSELDKTRKELEKEQEAADGKD